MSKLNQEEMTGAVSESDSEEELNEEAQWTAVRTRNKCSFQSVPVLVMTENKSNCLLPQKTSEEVGSCAPVNFIHSFKIRWIQKPYLGTKYLCQRVSWWFGSPVIKVNSGQSFLFIMMTNTAAKSISLDWSFDFSFIYYCINLEGTCLARFSFPPDRIRIWTITDLCWSLLSPFEPVALSVLFCCSVVQEPEWDVSSAFVANAANHIKLKGRKNRAVQISRENKENEAKSGQVLDMHACLSILVRTLIHIMYLIAPDVSHHDLILILTDG